MSSELIPLAEAAVQLGVSVEKLLEMRSNKQIFGIRDGSSWKFKKSELDRVKEDLGLGSGQISDIDTPVENVSDSMDLLDGSDELLLSDSGSGAMSGSLLRDSDELSLEDDQPAAKGKGKPDDTGKASDKENSDNLDLLDDELFKSDELSLQDSAGLDSGEMSSDFVDSSDVVVDDSDSSGSDSDSLLLDDEDLVVSNQGVEEDDFELSDSSILSLDDGGGADDFDLEPISESMDDQNSSSQVIALEDSDLMDDSHPTMMGGPSGDLLSADEFSDSGAVPLESFSESVFPTGQGAMAGGPAMVPAEPPFTALQILSLASTLLVTGLLAILSLDLAQNMWQPNDSGFSSNIANLLVDAMQFDR
ncbi:MAG: helix-turn-helix domain-containing protein [Planctomycetaceae bacterium]|nr:helix-turn-helix domain-containing protein [Planctomycetaceae bacterium]